MDGDSLFLNVDEIDLDAYRETKHEIRNPLYFREQLEQHFLTDPNEKGAFLPWGHTHGLRFRPGEVSLWGGQNFAGKSALLTQALLYWMRGKKYSDIDQRILLISPEFSPTINIARMVQQVTAKIPSQIDDVDVISVLGWLEKRFLIYDAVGQVDIDDLSTVIKYCVAEHGTTMVAIDNLTVMKLPSSDTNQAQGELMTSLVQTARTTGAHIHLVVHTRKPERGEQVNRYNIRGSSMLSDLADNVIMVERNEYKERILQDLTKTPEELQEARNQSDTRLHILKQRHGSAWIGMARLYFSPYSLRWTEDKHGPDLYFEEATGLGDVIRGTGTPSQVG